MADDIGAALTGTKLPLMDELEFQKWAQENGVPLSGDYDMRGYYQGLRQGSPHARPSEVNPNDMKPHFTDYYKMPWHETFSAESKGAGPDAPRWNRQDQLVGPDGKILVDEKFNKLLRR